MNHKKGIRFKKGDDGGCFSAALAAVRRWGGILEHPRNSAAWAHFGLNAPPVHGGWIRAEIGATGWTCCVFQGHYGHRALKPTWLYYVGDSPPPQLQWGRPAGEFVPVSGRSFHSKEERDRKIADGWTYKSRLPTKERSVTPVPFRDLLIGIALNSIKPPSEKKVFDTPQEKR